MRIGIDLGGTKTELIALDDHGLELYRERTPTPRGEYAPIMANIVQMIEKAELELGRRGTVGLGIPGAVSAKTGLVKNCNATELIGHRLDEDLSRKLGRNVRISNDANCLALSEAVDGAGKGHDMVYAVILGTGCGAGLAINGRAHNGANRVAGEFGHNPLPWMTSEEFPGPECWCGKKACLETYISGSGIARDYAAAETGGEILKSSKEIVEMAMDGDAGASAALDRYVTRLARALAHVVNILDPDVFVLGGGMSNVDLLYERVPPLLKDYVFGGECDTPVLKNKHGDSSGVRGAAWLWPKDMDTNITSSDKREAS